MHVETERIAIEGMHCANCSALIQKMVGKMDGVESCEVNLAANNGTVEFDPEVTNMPAVIETIVDLGYGATVIPREGRAAFDEERRAREAAQHAYDLRMFVMALVLAALVMIIGMTPLGMTLTMPLANAIFGPDHTHDQMMLVMNLVCMVLTIPVQFVAGRRFYRGAWGALKARSANMDTLVAVGTTIAFAYSLYVTFSPTTAGKMAPFETSGTVSPRLETGGGVSMLLCSMIAPYFSCRCDGLKRESRHTCISQMYRLEHDRWSLCYADVLARITRMSTRRPLVP